MLELFLGLLNYIFSIRTLSVELFCYDFGLSSFGQIHSNIFVALLWEVGSAEEDKEEINFVRAAKLQPWLPFDGAPPLGQMLLHIKLGFCLPFLVTGWQPKLPTYVTFT